MQRIFMFLNKILLLILLTWTVFFGVVIFIYEFNIESGISEYSFFVGHKVFYEKIRNFIFDQGKREEIQNKIVSVFLSLDQEKEKFFSTLERFRHDKELYDAIFLYIVSGNLPSLRKVIDTYWQNDPFLVECYVLGETGELLYKHGSYTLVPRRSASDKIYTFQRYDNLLDCILNWEDETFDRSLQMHFLFKEEKFLSWIQKSPVPILLHLGETVLQTSKTPRVDSLEYLRQHNTYEKFAVYRFPLLWKNHQIGEAFYFVKRYALQWFVGVFFKTLLVTSVFAAILIFFFWLDQLMSRSLTHQKKQDENRGELEEHSIQWIEEFIAQQQEEKK